MARQAMHKGPRRSARRPGFSGNARMVLTEDSLAKSKFRGPGYGVYGFRGTWSTRRGRRRVFIGVLRVIGREPARVKSEQSG